MKMHKHWDTFWATVYPGCDEKPDYSKSDLEFIVTEQAKKPMYTVEDLG
jgi:hypothetical protein